MRVETAPLQFLASFQTVWTETKLYFFSPLTAIFVNIIWLVIVDTTTAAPALYIVGQ